MKILSSLLTFVFLVTALPIGSLAEVPPVPIPRTPPAPVFTEAERHAELAKRRAAVEAAMKDNSVLVLFSAEPKLYANDVDYVFRQENNLYYLTALKQKGATLVIAKTGGNITETLFLPKRFPQQESWTGKMYSHEEATGLSGLKAILDSSEADDYLAALKSKAAFTSKDGAVKIPNSFENVYLLLPVAPQDSDGAREFRVENEYAKGLTGFKVENAQHIFANLRQIKSPYEIKLLQHAIDITTEAHLNSMAIVGRAKWEYEVHAEVEYIFRKRNADSWGYPSIVACGPNATTLHYEESQGPVKQGDLMLMDVGAEYDHYSADVTRTFPVNGKFTKEQAQIYQIVYDAQEAAAKVIKPGATMQQISAAANKVISEGLFKLGLVTDPNSTQFRLWYFHGLGHWIGMNVHDVGRNGIAFAPGMTFTNEPGIYIRADALDNLPNTPEWAAFKEKVGPAFAKYKNIGVRIEDDMLVTDTGAEWMTKKLPRSIADIEAFMAKASKGVSFNALLFQHSFHPSQNPLA